MEFVKNGQLNNLMVEDPTGNIRFVDYTSNGQEVRFICTEFNLKYLSNKYYVRIEKHVKDDNDVFQKIGEDYILEINNKYIKVIDQSVVERSEAYELIDDLNQEIMDLTDPENPVSFEPQQYVQVESLKDGYITEMDFFKSVIQANLNQLTDWSINLLAS